jgi:hypothetical protein
MSFFNPFEPVIRSKQESLDVQDLQGSWQIDFKIGNWQVFSGIYTRVDQAFLIWGVTTTAIFTTAQFFPISWNAQAIFWSLLTVAATAGMMATTWFWAKVERAVWVVLWWAILMALGLGFTHFSIFQGWGQGLLHLCHVWLGLSALGYLGTGLGLRSRAFLIAGILHLLSIVVLPQVGGWQFLTTGAVMGGSLLFFAQVQWDMRSPINYAQLSSEEREFNRQQYQIRQGFLREES